MFNIGWHVGRATTNYFHSGGIEREKWKIITKNNKQMYNYPIGSKITLLG